MHRPTWVILAEWARYMRNPNSTPTRLPSTLSHSWAGASRKIVHFRNWFHKNLLPTRLQISALPIPRRKADGCGLLTQAARFGEIASTFPFRDHHPSPLFPRGKCLAESLPGCPGFAGPCQQMGYPATSATHPLSPASTSVLTESTRTRCPIKKLSLSLFLEFKNN